MRYVAICYHQFGQALIDRTIVAAGIKNDFTFEFDGEHTLKEVYKKGRGALLISAHIGNFEIASHFYKNLGEDLKVHLVMADEETSAIKEFFDSRSKTKPPSIIHIKNDFSHIFKISAAINNNEWVCMTGDRYYEGNKTMEAQLLDKTAQFPSGPFIMAAKMDVPVLFVYAMKDSRTHYHLYAREIDGAINSPEQILEAYTANVNSMLKKYPTQWFNFFKFWED